MSPRGKGRVALLLDLLERNYRGSSWQGTSLRGSLRGLTPRQAAWKPGPGRNSCWNLLLHAAYWKYATRRRLEGGKRGGFGRGRSNWPPLPEGITQKAWREDLALLDEQHERLCQVVAGLSDAALDRPLGYRWTVAAALHGLASHDSYHTGQIQLLKRLMKMR